MASATRETVEAVRRVLDGRSIAPSKLSTVNERTTGSTVDANRSGSCDKKINIVASSNKPPVLTRRKSIGTAVMTVRTIDRRLQFRTSAGSRRKSTKVSKNTFNGTVVAGVNFDKSVSEPEVVGGLGLIKNSARSIF
jgi:hypothetical protein